MIYFVMSALLVAFIYVNLLGSWYKNIKYVPEGAYKEALQKYKKMELIEKGVITAILVGVVFSMKYFTEIATISLVAMVVILTLEYFFGKYIRKNLLCPNCGGSIWTGNFIVIIKPLKTCFHCDYPLYTNEPKEETTETNEDEEK